MKEIEIVFRDGQPLSRLCIVHLTTDSESESLSFSNLFRRWALSFPITYRVAGLRLFDQVTYLQNRDEFTQTTLEIIENLRSINFPLLSKEMLISIDREFKGDVRVSDIFKDIEFNEGEGSRILFTTINKVKVKMDILVDNESSEESIFTREGLEFMRVNYSFNPFTRVSINSNHIFNHVYELVLETREYVDFNRLILDFFRYVSDSIDSLEKSLKVREIGEFSKLEDLGMSLRSLAELRKNGIETLEQLVGSDIDIDRLSDESYRIYSYYLKRWRERA